jgi:hypothetical protein
VALKHQDGKDVMRELAAVLDAGVRVLMYSGQFDLIVHHLGTEKALEELQWRDREAFAAAKGAVFLVRASIQEYSYLHSRTPLLTLGGRYTRWIREERVASFHADCTRCWSYGTYGRPSRGSGDDFTLRRGPELCRQSSEPQDSGHPNHRL